jgi:MoaA/NifB/PqqE/SkfB family radical SAM enzyme
MIKTVAISPTVNEAMMVTWDTGRRCNYDCSYCEISRHDNTSPHHTLEEYIKTFKFIKQWTSIYNQYKHQSTFTNINFTGGEPTMNPVFWDLVDIINDDSKSFRLSLTTNGAWNKKFTNKIIERFSGVTVSYHAEGHPNLKKQVLENILALKQSSIWLQVNLMMHVDHWDECVEVYHLLKEQNITVKIRPIGDGNTERPGWFVDRDGSSRRTSHEYTEDQQQWYYAQTGSTESTGGYKLGTDIGRGCCGGRCLTGKVDGEWQPVSIIDTKFKDWNCMVDWFFLHIDQSTGLVYHHQTCQALHGKKKGALGLLHEADIMLADLANRMQNPSPIICPNHRCGCGMCIPKAKEFSDFEMLWKAISIVPIKEIIQ